MWFGTIQFVKGLSGIKRWRKSEFIHSVELGLPSSPVLQHQCSWFLDIQTQTSNCIIGAFSSWAFGLKLCLHHCISRLSSMKMKDHRTFGIYNYMNPYNKFLSFLSLYKPFVLFPWSTLINTLPSLQTFQHFLPSLLVRLMSRTVFLFKKH
jgi:hypothetical protein